jgi:hypothetical protein
MNLSRPAAQAESPATGRYPKQTKTVSQTIPERRTPESFRFQGSV